MRADKCQSCGRWMVEGQPHTCSPEPGELCSAVDISNCAEHGWGSTRKPKP